MPRPCCGRCGEVVSPSPPGKVISWLAARYRGPTMVPSLMALRMTTSRRGLAAAACMAALPAAHATNGYFPHGFGLKAKGMGGVSTALSQDAYGGANNPASISSLASLSSHASSFRAKHLKWRR
mgnify:CR=1 FL=1